jgi:enamine deaminase RidA (YjgF/YER057c/UK114 family)
MPSPVLSSPPELPSIPGFSQVAAIPAGSLVWTSGQVALRADGSLAAEDAEGQARQVFENVGAALRAGGAGWPDVVKLTIFVVDLGDLDAVRRVRDEFVDTTRPPTSSLVRVAGLVRPDLRLEVEAVAWIAG